MDLHLSLSSFIITDNALLAAAEMPNSFDISITSAHSHRSFVSWMVSHPIKPLIHPSSTSQLQTHQIMHKPSICWSITFWMGISARAMAVTGKYHGIKDVLCLSICCRALTKCTTAFGWCYQNLRGRTVMVLNTLLFHWGLQTTENIKQEQQLLRCAQGAQSKLHKGGFRQQNSPGAPEKTKPAFLSTETCLLPDDFAQSTPGQHWAEYCHWILLLSASEIVLLA